MVMNAKPTVVDVLSRLEGMGFFRPGGSPFTPPKITGRPDRFTVKGTGMRTRTLDAVLPLLPTDRPTEVQAGILLGETPGRDRAFSEPDLTAFLNHISGDNFDTETIGVATKNKEWDAAGWYCPLHFYGYEWGIYIRPRCIFEIALDIFAKYSPVIVQDVLRQAKERIPPFERDNTISEERKRELRARTTLYGREYMKWFDNDLAQLVTQFIQSAYYLIVRHELFHHFVESFAIKSECIARRPVYVSYADSVYKRAKGTNDLIEEALANAFAYRSVQHPNFSQVISIRSVGGVEIEDVVLAYLKDRSQTDPPGYNRALEFVTDRGLEQGLSLLLAQITESNIKPLRASPDASVLAGEFAPLFADEEVRCVEVPEALGQVILAKAAIPFDNRGKRLQKLMQTKGFILERQGKHEVWAKPGSSPIPVPRTRSLTDGTAEAILKKIDPVYRLRNFEEIMRSVNA